MDCRAGRGSPSTRRGSERQAPTRPHWLRFHASSPVKDCRLYVKSNGTEKEAKSQRGPTGITQFGIHSGIVSGAPSVDGRLTGGRPRHPGTPSGCRPRLRARGGRSSLGQGQGRPLPHCTVLAQTWGKVRTTAIHSKEVKTIKI